MQEGKKQEHPIILFDGVCNLCSSSVQFVIRHDPERHFRFASLQSSFAQELLKSYDFTTAAFRSFILVEKGILYSRSTAALRVCKRLKGGWKMLYTFMVIPPFIRNAVYDLVAHNRYRLFGKKEACWVPSTNLKSLFLDQ